MAGVVATYAYNTASSQLLLGVSNLSQLNDSQKTATASGVKSTTYAGLGSSRSQAISLQPAITQIGAWTGNITTAQNTLSTTQTAVQQISSIANDLNDTLATLQSNVSAGGVATAVSTAKNALNSLGSLLNTKQGSTYVFSGQDLQTAPVSDNGNLVNSTLASNIQSIVASTGSTSAQDVLSSTLQASADTTAGDPFSASLSTDPETASGQSVKAIVSQGAPVAIGVVATQGGAATDVSTGSPIRDLMRNLMVVASLGSVSAGSDSFNAIVKGLQQTNTSVVTGLSDMAGQMGVTQNSLTVQSSALGQMNSMLTDQLGKAKDVDLAQLSVQMTDTQNQLEASYSIISKMKGMTLASYL